MNAPQHPDEVATRQDLAAFVLQLGHEVQGAPETLTPQTWENATLPEFLEALSRWTEDMDGWHLNRGEQVPEQPTWALVAHMLRAAAMYE